MQRAHGRALRLPPGPLEERGATIAAAQPEWAKQLGGVPAEPARREEWTQLAAEIDVFRQQYHVDLQAQQRARAAKLQEQLRRSGVKVAPTRDGDRTATDRQNERVRDQGGRER